MFKVYSFHLSYMNICNCNYVIIIMKANKIYIFMISYTFGWVYLYSVIICLFDNYYQILNEKTVYTT